MKLLAIAVYREVILRHRVNDAGRSLLMANATGDDRDQLGALFGVRRRELVPADPDSRSLAMMEADPDLRRRLLLVPDSYSVAGPELAALSADGDVLDASATSPSPGEVAVSVLSRIGNGTASPALLDAVRIAVTSDIVRPLTDSVTMQSASFTSFAITAELTLLPGPDPTLALDTARQAVTDMARPLPDDLRRLLEQQ